MELVKKLIMITSLLLSLTAFAGGGDSGGGPKSLSLNKKSKGFRITDIKLKTIKVDGKKIKLPHVYVYFRSYEMITRHESSNDKEVIREMGYVPRTAKLPVDPKEIPAELMDKLKNRKWFHFFKKSYFKKAARELYNVEVCEKPEKPKKKVRVRRIGKHRRRF
ncbi:MAG: hypothetical protein GY909_18730 [Oligoflexia bacterium]|nr:hypothetical protein [Oligoflexia bacterium]